MLLAAFGVLFIGIAKAGFGGGLGMLVTPICVLAFGAGGKPPSYAIGVLLPLLCAGDAFSLYHYWGKWRQENLKFLLPGVVMGVIIGVEMIDHFTPRQLNIAIGIIALLFVGFQCAKDWIFDQEGAFQPTYNTGLPCGLGAGITSTFAHGAGPVVSMFLIPQQMPKELFVGTTVLIFTWINWIKMPFFVANHIIDRERFLVSLCYLPLVPVGVWLGVWMNRKLSESMFLKLIHLFIFLAGLQLIFNFDLGKLIKL